MSDPIQAAVVAAPAPVVRPEPAVEAVAPPHIENGVPNEGKKGERPPIATEARASHRLTITRDALLNAFVYRSVDGDTGEVLWQWPAEGALRRARYWRELAERGGLPLVDQKA